MIASAASVRPLSQRTTNGRCPSSSRHHMLALDARADIFGLSPHLLHQPWPLDRLRKSGVILDVGRGHQLAARLEAGQHQRLQQSARGVDRRRVGGRPRADNDKALMLNSGRRQLHPRILALPRGPARLSRRSLALIWG